MRHSLSLSLLPLFFPLRYACVAVGLTMIRVEMRAHEISAIFNCPATSNSPASQLSAAVLWLRLTLTRSHRVR